MPANKNKVKKIKADVDNKVEDKTKNVNTTENNTKLPKKRQINQARLIKLIYKKTRLIKFRKDYGANFVEETKYFLTKQHAIDFGEKEIIEQEKQVQSAGKKEEDKKKVKKKKWLNFLYFALNILVIGIVLAVQLNKEDDPTESLSAILNINWWFILAAVGTFVACILLEQVRYLVLIHKATGVFRFRLSYKVTALGRHYDIITPLSTGGQPFQIFYLNKYGIKAGESISIIMGRYIFYQIVYFICITYILLRNVFADTVMSLISGPAGALVTTLSWIGYAICAVVIIAITFVTLNRRAGSNFIAGILKFLNKIRIGKFKIIKDYKGAFVKSMRTVNTWQETTKKYSKSFWVILVNILASILYFLSWYSMPYFVYCAFAGWNPDVWLQILTVAVMVDLTSAFNPIPMGVGTADLSFTVLYGLFFAGIPGAQIWALIIWRILAYYIYILQGLGVLTYDYFIGDRRLKKYKEYWMKPYRERFKIKMEEIKNKKGKQKAEN